MDFLTNCLHMWTKSTDVFFGRVNVRNRSKSPTTRYEVYTTYPSSLLHYIYSKKETKAIKQYYVVKTSKGFQGVLGQ